MGANKVLDARFALSGTKAGKWTKAIGTSYITPAQIPGLPTIAGVSGGLPSIAISGGFSSFGRQSTNPQWQNPSVLDPKVNYSWAKGKHSLKFGYEYEYVWMEVEDSNPLYGSFTFNHGYSLCPAAAGAACPVTGTYYTTPATTNSAVSDTYWADFLFGTSGSYSLSTYWTSHLHQNMESGYAQDDWKINPKLTLNLGLRWEYGSPYSERGNYLSNFNPATGTMQTLTPNFSTMSNGLQASGYPNIETGTISSYNGGGVYGKPLSAVPRRRRSLGSLSGQGRWLAALRRRLEAEAEAQSRAWEQGHRRAEGEALSLALGPGREPLPEQRQEQTQVSPPAEQALPSRSSTACPLGF
jgi:outer membrane receptor protein involved in Fe transport